MARVALPKPEQITDPAVEGIFAWVTEMEGSVPNHFYLNLVNHLRSTWPLSFAIAMGVLVSLNSERGTDSTNPLFHVNSFQLTLCFSFHLKLQKLYYWIQLEFY